MRGKAYHRGKEVNMQLSSLIGKPVLSPAGEAYGYITAARPTKDLTKLACLIAADGEEEEFVIPARAVLSWGDAVIAGRTRSDAPSGVEAPIGKEIYAYTGEYLGTVCDLLFGDGSEAILVVTKEGVRTTAAASCAVFGEHIVLYLDKESRDAAARNGGKRKTAVSRPPRPRPAAKEKLAPAADPAKEHPIPAPETKNEAPMSGEASSKTNVIQVLNRTNLLGRKVKKSVYDDYGIPVVLAGERITPSVLARARLAGRLLALTVNTLTVF